MKALKNIITVLLIFSAVLVFSACDKAEITLPANSDAPSAEEIGDVGELLDSLNPQIYCEIDYGEIKISDSFNFDRISNIVKIEIEGYGSVYIELRPDIAPETVNNFKKLTLEGFYDGLTFHRVVKDFMIEGGEQDVDGVIHDSEMIYGEFTDNNFTNNLSHKRGVIAMSRKNIPDSASSGFFVVTKDSPQLDGRYAAFGYVVSGMDVIDKIQNAEVGANGSPTEPIIIRKISFVEMIVEG